MSCTVEIRDKIDRDIREESRGRDAADIFIGARIKAAFQRDNAKRAFANAHPRNAPDLSPVAVPVTPDPAGEASDGFDWYHAAQGDYEAVCANQTGQTVPDLVFETGRLRRAQQDETTVELAKALDSTGRYAESPYYKGENDPNRCTVIGLFTGEELPLPAVKRASALPSIAKANRAKMLRDIEHFLATLPGSGRKAGMFTLTNGPRVAINRVTLREDIRNFHRWLSKMAATPAFKRYGVKMEWRATEFGSPEWDPNTGQMTLHLHAHCLVTVPEHMSHRQRSRMRKKLWRVFGVQWDDAGDISNPREFVKYPVKDGDLVKILREAGPGVLADFCEAWRGMHIVQPMGELKRVRNHRRQNARRITAFSRLDGRTLEETGDWNAGKRPLTKPNANRRAYRELSKSVAALMACADHCRRFGTAAGDTLTADTPQTPGNAQESPSDSGGDDPDGPEDGRPQSGCAEPSGHKATPPKNRVIALLAPAPYGSPICEPGVVVWGFDGNLQAVLRQPRVAAIVARHRQAYDDAAAARALIRACAPARAAHAASEGSQRSNNCPAAVAPPDRPRPAEPAWSTEMLLEFARS